MDRKRLKGWLATIFLILLLIGILFSGAFLFVQFTSSISIRSRSGLLESFDIKYEKSQPNYNNESVGQFVVSSYNQRYCRISLKFVDLDINARYMLFQNSTSSIEGFDISFDDVTEKIFFLVVYKSDFGLYKFSESSNGWYRIIFFNFKR